VVRVSVQIVTWNSVENIDACLQALARQSTTEFEVIVVDNASRDGTADHAARWLEGELSGCLLRLSENTGFCGGQNLAFERSRGDLILFLNPDVVLSPTFIADAIRRSDELPALVGTIAPSICLPDGRIDSTGLILDRFRRGWDRDHGHDRADPPARGADEVFGCTGAVAIHRRAMLLDVAIDGKPLDELMFAYYDDVDLAWRARLRGWRCRHEPTLTATHARAARNGLRGRGSRRTRDRDQMLTVRNRLLMIVKCERARHALVALPLYVAFEIARIGYLTVRAPAALRGYIEFLSVLPEALAARRHVQAGIRGAARLRPAVRPKGDLP
jgi:GT2 family glycosyltransferase